MDFRPPCRGRAGGYAALTAVLMILFSSLAVIAGLTFLSLQEAAHTRASIKAIDARAIADAGIEDASYRIVSLKQIAPSETLNVGKGAVAITVSANGSARTIRSAGKRDTVNQTIETLLETSTDGASFFFGAQVGDGGMIMDNGAQVVGNVYSNGDITGGTITGTAIVAGGITTAPRLEWTVQNADQFFATAAGNRDMAQSFTAPAGGPLVKVSVLLAKVGAPSDLTLRITRDSAGKPDRNGELANAAIAASQVRTDAGWIDVPLDSPPTLANGTKYWIVLDYTASSASNHWNWRKDSSDGYDADANTGRYANDWNSASATWVNVGGDLSFKAWVGGTNTKIANAAVGTAGRANLFTNDTIGGSACPNPNCIVENPARLDMPISEETIRQWKDEAACGMCALINGDYHVSGTASVGPAKITGNVTFSNGSTLIIKGTLWVAGNVTFANNCAIQLAAGTPPTGYGNTSGVIVVDGAVTVANNCTLAGSGSPGSYLLLLDDKDARSSQVMDISNNAAGVIYYAAKGRIRLRNNAGAREIVAYGLDLDNNAVVTYDSGLADLTFSSGPSGGYALRYWKRAP